MNTDRHIHVEISPKQYANLIENGGVLLQDPNSEEKLCGRIIHPRNQDILEHLVSKFDELVTYREFPSLENMPKSGCSLIVINGNYVYQHYDELEENKVLDERFFDGPEDFIDYILPLFLSYVTRLWPIINTVPHWLSKEGIYTPDLTDYKPDVDFYFNLLSAVFRQNEKSLLPSIKYPSFEKTFTLLDKKKEEIVALYQLEKSDQGYQSFFTERGVKQPYMNFSNFEEFVKKTFFEIRKDDYFYLHFTIGQCALHPYDIKMNKP